MERKSTHTGKLQTKGAVASDDKYFGNWGDGNPWAEADKGERGGRRGLGGGKALGRHEKGDPESLEEDTYEIGMPREKRGSAVNRKGDARRPHV